MSLLTLFGSGSQAVPNALYAKAAGGNWNDASTWSAYSAAATDNAGPPTAASNCFLTSGSGNVTIAAAAVCRSLDCNGYTGTLTHNAATTLSIGDGTAGAGNRALRLASGMTYTLGNTVNSFISFVSTNTNEQTIDFAGKTHANLTIDGVGCNYKLTAASTQTAASNTSVTLVNGTFNTNGQTCTWGSLGASNSNTRSLTLGASAITIFRSSTTAWNIGTTTGMTLNAGTSVITCTGDTVNFTGGTGLTYYDVRQTGAGVCILGGSTIFTHYTRSGTAVKTDALSLAGNPTITGTLNLNGNSLTNRILVTSNVLGTTRTFTKTGATVNASNVDFRDINFASGTTNLSAITGGSGDCGGNSGITFTTPATKYWVGNGGNWSDPTNHWALSSGGAAGANNLPLPQDDVVFDANSFSSGSQTVTSDMPRVGKSIDWTGATNSPTLSVTVARTVYGSMTLIAGMTYTGGSGTTFEGRGSFTLTSAGQSFASPTVQMIGGTLTLSDAMSVPSGVLTLINGTMNFGSFTHTIFSFLTSGTATRAINLQSSTILLGNNTGTVTVWDHPSTGLTFDAGTSTLKLSNTDTNTKIFNGRALTYNNLTLTGTGTGNRNITGNNTFNAVTNDNAGTVFKLRLSAAATQTVSSLALAGTSGNLVTVESATAASATTFTDASGTNTFDYCSIQDITAAGGATWNATNSTNVSGNTGINFI